MAIPPSRFIPSPPAWRGAAVGVFIATLFLMALSTLDLLQNNVSLGDAAIYFVGGSLITAFIGAMLVFMWVVFANISGLSKWAIACFALLVYYFFIPAQTSTGLILIGIWTIASFSLTCGAIWSLIANRNDRKSYPVTFAWLLLGLFGLAYLVFWFHSTTSTFSPPSIIESKKKIQLIDLPDPALQGSWTVQSLSYAHGTDTTRAEYGKNAAIHTKTVNGIPFIYGWRGFSGWLRTRYWGFDASEIPLNGQVWYPEGVGPFPLVMILHGNHEMSAASDKGYAYLANLLASRGFIAVSIDQNFLNGGWIDFTGSLNEVAGRAWLILEHLQLCKEWNNSSDSPFANKIDMQKIALIGHSRGGEAIATAAALNELDYFPGNGNIRFNYHFAIKALAAIAPVDSQYSPGGKKTSLKNIDYLVLQGAHDGDVRSFQGTAQYNRVHFSGSNYHFKAALYIYGANHGQFNTQWGKNDNQSPGSLFFNVNQFLPEKEQRQIAQVYITAFLEAVLHGKTGYLPLFHTWRAGRNWLPKTLYFNEFADSNETVITNDQKTIDLGKTIHSGTTAKGEHLAVWRQKEITLREGNAIHPATFLGWKSFSKKNVPSYTITLSEKKISVNEKSTLVLSLADGSHLEDEDTEEEDEKETVGNKSGNPIDFTIELVDSKGNKAALPLSQDAFLQPTLQLHLMRSDLLDPLVSSETVFQTFEFPLEDFIKDNPEFDPAKLHEIRLLFNRTPSGLIILDSISIRHE